MKTAIFYMSKHGCVEKAVFLLKEYLKNDEVEIINLKKDKIKDPESYDKIILGGSIHAGMIQRKIKTFYSRHLNVLLKKKLGLFLCCMEEGEKAKKQFDKVFPAKLRTHAKTTGLFGGEFIFGKMKPVEKFIIKKIAKTDKDISKFKKEEVKLFAENFD